MNPRRYGELILLAALSCSNANDPNGGGASGSSAKSAQARCERICATVAALRCPNASPQATCDADCEKVAAAPTACPSGLAGYYQCAADAPVSSWECDALSGPLVPRLRASRRASAFLDGVNVASLALMALVTLQLGRAALRDLPTWMLALLACGLLLRFRLNSTWLVLGGGAAGLALYGLGLAGG